MGVINKNKAVCETGDAREPMPDIPINEDEILVQRNTFQQNTLPYFEVILKQDKKPLRPGKRKQQRYENNIFIQRLGEMFDRLNISDFEFQDTPSNFQILMETCDDPIELLNKFDEEREERFKIVKYENETPQFHVYNNIPKKIRRIFAKTKELHLNVLRDIEWELYEVLIGEIEGFGIIPKTSYENYLIHAAAVFHGFLFSGYKESAKVCKSIRCDCDDQPCFLADYLQEKQRKYVE